MEYMKIKDLKEIVNNLPDDMIIVMPTFEEGDDNYIDRFRIVNTAGILSCPYEEDRLVFCLSSGKDQDIANQVQYSHKSDIGVEAVLFGSTKYEKGE